MLTSLWSKGNTHLWLAGVQTCTAIVEISEEVPQEAGNPSAFRPIYTTLGHIPEKHFILPETLV